MAMLAGMQEILINFDEKALDKLRNEFEDLGLSLDFSQFVTCMRKMLPELCARDKVQFVSDIRELFDEIDINGDGDLEWGEFTAYCANLGFVATKQKTVETQTRKYTLDDLMDSRLFKGPCIEQVLYIEQFKMLVVLESLSTSLMFFDTRFRLTHSFQPPVQLRTILGRKGDNIDVDIGAPSIKHVCYAPVMEAICINTNDGWLSLYHVTEQNQLFSVFSPLTVSFCCWCNDAEMLLTVAGDNNHLQCWDIKSEQQVPVDRCCEKSEIGITAIVEVRPHKIMITSGNRLSLWNLTMDKVNHRGHLKRMRRQVERLVYSEAHDILLTTSTDRDCVGWDLATRSPMLYLKGHRYSLADVRLAPFGAQQHAVTVDRHGVVKVWNISRTVSGFATCLQSIDTRATARCLGIITPKCDLVVGADKLRVLRCKTEETELAPPTCAIYNPLFATVLVALGDSVKIYDAHTGRQSDFFPRLCNSDISAVCLDDRKRKFCVGTNEGEILVCSYQDGVPLKQVINPAHKHKGEVVALLYNDEDKCLVSAAWDRRMCVWDEDPREEVELLRMTHNAHRSDILCMAHSRRLSLIATGSVDLLVKVFDFQFCKQLVVLEGHETDVTCLSFVDPYALLVSGDASGTLIFWQLRPLRWAKIAVLRNDQEVQAPPPPLPSAGLGGVYALGTNDGKAPKVNAVGPPTAQSGAKKPSRGGKAGTTGVVVLALLRCEHKQGMHLYTGDEAGIVRCWNISVLLSELTVPSEKRLLTSKTSYNPNRRIEQTCNDNAADLLHVGKVYKRSMPNLAVDILASGKSATMSISTRARARRRKLGNVIEATRRLKKKSLPELPALVPQSKRKFTLHLPDAVRSRPATALETERFVLLHKWKAHFDTIKSLQVVEDPVVVVTASVDMSVCFWKPDGERAGLIDLKRGFSKKKNKDWNFKVDWSYMIEQKRQYAREFLAEERLRKQKHQREQEWQRAAEAREREIRSRLSPKAAAAANKRAPVRHNSCEEGPAQTLLRKGRQVTHKSKKNKGFLAAIGPRSIKPTSAQRRRADVRTSILAQLKKTSGWQAAHSIDEVVEKQSPTAPKDARCKRYSMPSLEALKARYRL